MDHNRLVLRKHVTKYPSPLQTNHVQTGANITLNPHSEEQKSWGGVDGRRRVDGEGGAGRRGEADFRH